MQLKKKEIQMKIQNVALEMFYRLGYDKTKMSDIASKLDMSVGNIYTYFENKSILFYTVVPQETIDYFEEVLVGVIKTYNDLLTNQKEYVECYDYLAKQMQLITTNYREIVIMLDKSDETNYADMKEKLIDEMVEDRIKKETLIGIDESMSEEEIRRFFKISGQLFIEMMLMTLKEENISNEERYRLCMLLITYNLKNDES